MNLTGRDGEDYAAEILRRSGYKVLRRNFHSKYGEIDIIAEKGDIIAFVEVKTRAPSSVVTGFEAVTRSKRRKLIATALYYIQLTGCDLQPRFDVLSIEAKSGAILSHDHLEGAFDSEAYYKGR
jgi:putative endonuclease